MAFPTVPSSSLRPLGESLFPAVRDNIRRAGLQTDLLSRETGRPLEDPAFADFAKAAEWELQKLEDSSLDDVAASSLLRYPVARPAALCPVDSPSEVLARSKRPAEEELSGASAPKAARAALDVLAEAAHQLASSSSHAAAPAALRPERGGARASATSRAAASASSHVPSADTEVKAPPAEQADLNTLLQTIRFTPKDSAYLHRLVMTVLLRQEDCGLTQEPPSSTYRTLTTVTHYRRIPFGLFFDEAASKEKSLTGTDLELIQTKILPYIRTGTKKKDGVNYASLRAFLEKCVQDRRRLAVES